mgnify:CR=1 FL=1|jgi:type IV pilus assembly protein PilN
MKDLNYFEPLIEKKELNINKRLICYFIFIFLIVFLISYSTFNQVKVRQVSKDISKLKSIAEDEEINKKIKEINRKDKELGELKEYLEKIKLLDKVVEDNSIIDDYLLENITSRMPQDVFFTSISMYTDNIEIVGVSKDKWSIAELGKSLESVEEFQEVFITNISPEEENYKFILNINLKDVDIDGENTTAEEDEEKTNEE